MMFNICELCSSFFLEKNTGLLQKQFFEGFTHFLILLIKIIKIQFWINVGFLTCTIKTEAVRLAEKLD